LSRIYLSVSTLYILISISYCIYIAYILLAEKKLLLFVRGNSLLLSWVFLLPPGLLLVVVFLIENAHQIYYQENLKDGILCQFCAFSAITTLTTLHGSTTTVAYLTYVSVKTGKKPDRIVVIYGNIFSWLLGVGIGCVYLTGNVLGPYRGIYCCVKQQSFRGLLVAEMFLIFGFTALFQLYFYISAYLLAKTHQRQGNTSRTRTSSIIMRRGLEMVSIFYLSYTLINADAVAVFSLNDPPVWLSIIAAWIVKLEPFWHCLLIHRLLKRLQKNKAKIHPQPQENRHRPTKRSAASSAFSIFQSFNSLRIRKHSRTKKKYSLISVRKNIQQCEQAREVKSPRD